MRVSRQSIAEDDPISIANQVDIICDDFESSWRNGNRPEISTFLVETPISLHESLVPELVRLEYSVRRECGETPSVREYLFLYPDHRKQIFRGLQEERCLRERRLPPLQRGDLIDRFELEAPIGRGGFGEVWRAHDRMLNLAVAVKVSLPDQAGTDSLRFFLREASAVAQLNHPHIVGVRAVGEDGGRAYVVSDYCAGGDLDDWLRENYLTDHDGARLCLKLACALQSAHENGIVHRDVKPSNVLMGLDGEPKLTDFGLAKNAADSLITTLMTDGRALGTPQYMSPEQAAGKREKVQPQTDIYSLGVVLYRLLTGVLPFNGDLATILDKIKSTEPVPPRKIRASIPRPLETICLKAVEKRPSRRYASADAFAEDLNRFLKGQPIKARPVGLLQRIYRRLCRHPGVAATGGVATSMACALFAFLAIPSQSIDPNLQQVFITSEPDGAKVAFVRLEEMSHEPIPTEITHAASRTPANVTLRPGDYLVVVYLDNGRFHEVFRHVPTLDESESFCKGRSLASVAGCAHFVVAADGAIMLPPVRIPELDVTEGMAFVKGASSFRLETENEPLAIRQDRRIPDFYIEPREYTHADYKRLERSRGISYVESKEIIANLQLSDDAPLRVNWPVAMNLAERQGKRLPTSAEFQFVAMNRGRSEYPWGDELPDGGELVDRFGPAGDLSFDSLYLPEQPPIYGLCSNVAEWTGSFGALPSIAQPVPIARGGTMGVINGDSRVTIEMRNPRQRALERYDTTKPGLGFRMVRSARPRIRPEDFEMILEESGVDSSIQTRNRPIVSN